MAHCNPDYKKKLGRVSITKKKIKILYRFLLYDHFECNINANVHMII